MARSKKSQSKRNTTVRQIAKQHQQKSYNANLNIVSGILTVKRFTSKWS